MKPRFQADNDLLGAIRKGVLRREPAIDFKTASAAGLDAVADLDVLRRAAAERRILVSHDVTTMPSALDQLARTATRCPGVFLVPQGTAVSTIIESIVLVWIASDAEEWEGRLVWLPL